jgi:hypothetical protein
MTKYTIFQDRRDNNGKGPTTFVYCAYRFGSSEIDYENEDLMNVVAWVDQKNAEPEGGQA